jgi:hypothetical protein
MKCCKYFDHKIILKSFVNVHHVLFWQKKLLMAHEKLVASKQMINGLPISLAQ